MLLRKKLLWSLVLGGLAFQSAQADARDRWERRQERRERMEERLGTELDDARRQMGPGEAARIAQARNGGGRVLEVLRADGGWRVKLIRDGEVRMMFVSDED